MTRFKAGDEVFVRLPECHRGAWSELARSTEEFVALKPKSISMEDAASIPLACMTALQALRGYDGNLEGKTVFIPAGCKSSQTFTFRDRMFTMIQWVELVYSGVNSRRIFSELAR